VEELTIVGYLEEPEVGILFDSLTGHYYVHQSCIIWSSNNQVLLPELACRAVLQASSRRCAYCSHYGAGISCKVSYSLAIYYIIYYYIYYILLYILYNYIYYILQSVI